MVYPRKRQKVVPYAPGEAPVDKVNQKISLDKPPYNNLTVPLYLYLIRLSYLSAQDKLFLYHSKNRLLFLKILFSYLLLILHFFLAVSIDLK